MSAAARSRSEELLWQALKGLPAKPADSEPQAKKKAYSEALSKAVAIALAEELRNRGLKGTYPSLPGVAGVTGAERRMAGGIGAKKVDVTWATETGGLLLAISVKSVNFRDKRTKNFQKNITNRRGDLLFETVTLHRRFPYAVIGGFFFLDKESENDGTGKRKSTFENTNTRLRLFTGREDPAGRDEQLEVLCIILLDANPFDPKFEICIAGEADKPTRLDSVLERLIRLVAERNSDFFEMDTAGNLVPLRTRGKAVPATPALPLVPERATEESEAEVVDDVEEDEDE